MNIDVPAPVDPDLVVEALLFSVSHDLRSPLLTLSLAGELIVEALGDRLRDEQPSSGLIALEALQHGARDLERMLQALTVVSRARRRQIDVGRAPLRMLLGGHVVLSDAGDLGAEVVRIDPIVLLEVIDTVCGDEPTEIQVTLVPDHVVLRLPMPEALGEVRGSPLVALAQSLQQHAGTLVESLAAGQVLLERSRCRLAVQDDGVYVWIPRGDGSAEA